MNYLLKIPNISLKGINRKVFEKILIRNLKIKLVGDLNFLKNLGGVF